MGRKAVCAGFGIMAISTWPAAAQSRESAIRCDSSITSATIPGLPDQADPLPGSRHYVLDDSARTLFIISNGERQNACAPGSCRLAYSSSEVVTTFGSTDRLRITTRIDRLSGRFTELMEVFNARGRVMTANREGSCLPTTEARF